MESEAIAELCKVSCLLQMQSNSAMTSTFPYLEAEFLGRLLHFHPCILNEEWFICIESEQDKEKPVTEYPLI